MNILMVHNFYQRRGGEDRCFETEIDLLEAHGHQVTRYILHNDIIKGMHAIQIGLKTLWNQQTYRELRALIRQKRPDVVHFQNTFPLVSPAAYYAAHQENKPVIQTLQNYRLLCPGATFYRNGRTCEDCLGKRVAWPGVVHGCYRQNKLASSTVALMLTGHHLLRTWTNLVDRYIAVTNFNREKLIQGGLPAEKIVIKPNFIYPDPGAGTYSRPEAIFVGRLTPEKGVATLLSAWKILNGKTPLKIVGEGPLETEVCAAQKAGLKVEWLGQIRPEEVLHLMKGSNFLVFPSEWYEGFPRTIVEAFACGLPVIGSQLGSMSEIIENYRTGLFFQPGNAGHLADRVEWALSHPQQLELMRLEARCEFEAKYSAEQNYQILMEIYQSTLG
jgi:glycosyltransferase involved in cell wall biosynthesis